MVVFLLGRHNDEYPTIEDGSPLKMLIDFFNINMSQRGINSYSDLTEEEKAVISEEDFNIYCV